jgi:sulfur-carrier protein
MPRLLSALDLTPMRVNLLYFASFRDAAGLSEQVRELPEGTRVGQLWEAVAREIPRLAAFPGMPPAAVNREYVDGETLLSEGDEVAFLPPVAGG